jgi:hypothetical protein
MQVKLHIPTKAQILSGGFVVRPAKSGESWSKTQLGAYADSRGVYIHHSNGQILYIGKTTGGSYGTFGERLRREFQETASSNSALHQLLCSQGDEIRTHLLPHLNPTAETMKTGPRQKDSARKMTFRAPPME